MVKKLGSVLVVLLLIGGILFLTARVFFEGQYRAYFGELFSSEEVSLTQDISNFRVSGYFESKDFRLDTLDPFVRTPVNLAYESLIEIDDDLGLRPSLALSWGLVDENTWQFKLRPNVRFHDKSSFDADDVLLSYKRAVAANESDVSVFFSTVREVKKINDSTVQFELMSPDATFLNKLSYLKISSDGQLSDDSMNGTGPFKFLNSSDVQMVFERNENYWGPKPALVKLTFLLQENPADRLNDLQKGTVDLALRLPEDAPNLLNEGSFSILNLPRLEIFMLIFNGSSDAFNSSVLREAVKLAIDKQALVDTLKDSIVPISQFAPRGILGSDSSIDEANLDIYGARDIVVNNYEDNPKLNLHFLDGTGAVADQIVSDLKLANIDVTASGLSWSEFQKSLVQGKADFYLLSWKFNLPELTEFYKTFVHTYDSKTKWGSLNKVLYKNVNVNELIEEAALELDVLERNKKLQSVMHLLVGEKSFGVPLFELNSLNAHSNAFFVPATANGQVDYVNIMTR